MAHSEDSPLVSIAGPAAILGFALLTLGLHLNRAARHPAHLAALLRGSGGNLASVSVIDAHGGSWEAELAAILAAAVLILGSLVLRLRGRARVAPGLLGRARRAGARDLRHLRRRFREDLQRGPRVRLGDHRGRPLWLPPDEHLLALGPTGSGKSSALAIPALLEWPGPVVVTDPKGELVRSTLAHRRRLGATAVFAPLMRPTSRWDPVAAIQSSEDALRVSAFLMGKSPEREPFWHDLARQLLHGLLVEACQQQLTLGGLLEMLQVIPAEELADEVRHASARRLVQGALSGGDRTAMGVVATLVSQLGAYGSEQVAEATSSSDFDPADLAGGKLGTIYCVVSPHDAPVLRGLISALISCCWRSLFATPPSPPALFVLDEFTQLTNLPELPALVQLGRSQGVRLMLMAQDLGSITATYGSEASGALWSNCRTKLVLPGISELELLERVSKLAGTATLHRARDPWSSEPVASSPLLHPDDVRRLGPSQALLLHGGDQPAIIQQHRWFADRALSARVGRGPQLELPQPARGRPIRDWTDSDPRRLPSVTPLRWDPADVDA
ncbi:MAG: type IV secretory system conjugative DNA transfer family protein [Candidatus Dormibacteria bacterium]